MARHREALLREAKMERHDERRVRELVVGAFILNSPELLSRRATREEAENFSEDADEVFDPNEFGVANAEWTTFAHDVETLKSLLIVIERGEHDVNSPGSVRVYGAGQWLRETLWAATGVVPRDPGAPGPESALFGSAFRFFGRDEFQPASA